MKDYLPYIFPWLMNLVRYIIFAGIPFLIFYILFPQVFSKNKIQGRQANNKDFYREILYSLQTTIIIGLTVVLFMNTPLREFTMVYTDLSDFPLWWVPLSILLSLILHDTYFYWMHRMVHHPKLYKRVHLLHHKSVNPSPWASYSFHLSEAILEAMITPVILLLIPIHPLALITFALLAFIFNVYGHLGYEITPRWFRHSFLFEVLNTSTHHNLHHSKFKGNYGLYFRVWDRIMGTEYPDYVKEFDAIQLKRFGAYVPKRKWKAVFSIFFIVGILSLILGYTVL